MCSFWTCWAWDGVFTCSCEMSCDSYVKIPMCQLFCWLLGYVGNYFFHTLLLHVIPSCSWPKGRLCEFWEPEEKQPPLCSEGTPGFSLFLLFTFLTLALPTISDPRPLLDASRAAHRGGSLEEPTTFCRLWSPTLQQRVLASTALCKFWLVVTLLCFFNYIFQIFIFPVLPTIKCWFLP